MCETIDPFGRSLTGCKRAMATGADFKRQAEEAVRGRQRLWLEVSSGRLRAVGVLALVAAGVVGGQSAMVALTGKELCVGQGCTLVGGLSRLSPALFNLFGAAVFFAIGCLALAVRRPTLAHGRAFLCAALTGALAAEGVLFAYQWHVAGAWCVYCLGILAIVIALNLLFSPAGALLGLSSFAASAGIFSLLSFTPFNKTLEDGTYAVRGASNSPELYLLFSENCPHCHQVLSALEKWPGCGVRLNPVASLPADPLEGLEKKAGFDPRINVAAATILGIRTVPVLVAKQPDGIRITTGADNIVRYLKRACSQDKTGSSLFEPSSDLLLPRAEDGCGLKADCD